MLFYTPIKVVDGRYKGLMSGYEIKFDYRGKTVHVTTKTVGLRGINCPVIFDVVEGAIDETSIESAGTN